MSTYYFWNEKQNRKSETPADEFFFAVVGNREELISFDERSVMSKQYLIIY